MLGISTRISRQKFSRATIQKATYLYYGALALQGSTVLKTQDEQLFCSISQLSCKGSHFAACFISVLHGKFTAKHDTMILPPGCVTG